MRTVRMRERPRRTPLERALMRRPAALRAFGDVAMRVPVVRTALLRAVIDHAYAALARGDLELTAVLFYDVGVVHSPKRDGLTKLVRIEGANLDRIKRSNIKAAAKVEA